MWGTILEVLFSIIGIFLKNKQKSDELKEKFLKYLGEEESQTTSKKIKNEYSKHLDELNSAKKSAIETKNTTKQQK